MLGSEKNFKNENTALGIVIKDSNISISYTKTNKLITALYMVTDIIEKDEPLRNKLRTLGMSIISDIYSNPTKALPKILEIMSFLDIALVVNLISEMNASILRKEFFELKQSINQLNQSSKSSLSDINLEDLFKSDFSLPSTKLISEQNKDIQNTASARIGVQKGSTLMKALNKFQYMPNSNTMSDTGLAKGHQSFGQGNKMSDRKAVSNIDFNVLKGERRNEIISIIKTSPNGSTITDIKSRANGSLATCSEKTLQRELLWMLKDRVLKKTGEKRWSRYFIA